MKPLKQIPPAWIATALAALILVWLLSGIGGAATSESITAEGVASGSLTTVSVRRSLAEPLVREASVSARTAAARSVTLRAERSGRVDEILVERGEAVAENALILRLDTGDLPAQLARAEALERQRTLQFEAAQRLQTRGHQSPVDLATAKANLAQARAEREQIREALEHTEIRAPFAGLLESRPVEIGHFVSVGDELGLVIQQDPIIVHGQVTEDVVRYLKPGGAGRARMPDGVERAGQLRFVASQADSRTRTFAVELSIPNPAARLVAGASAVLYLPLETVQAHELEPAILALDAEGDFGVKSVAADGTVRFHPATIAQSREDRLWLSGLPPQLDVITVGQGFVSTGEKVTAQVEDPGA